ncbi:MAG TPA: putative porin [Marinagarivorans sp.]
MKKLLAIAALSTLAASTASAETYQLLSKIGVTDTDQEGSDASILANGTYYFSGQETVGPLDQFAYIDDTTNIRAVVESNDAADQFQIGGSYYFDRFAVGLDYYDYDGSSKTRLHADYFFADNFKASFAYNMPDEGDDVAELNLQYDHSINEQDYIGFTLSYIDYEDALVSLSSKYLNGFENGQFLVIEANVASSDGDTAVEASAKWYLNKHTGFIFGANDDDYMYIGATHFFNTNFAIDATIGQDEDFFGDSYKVYNLSAVLQF